MLNDLADTYAPEELANFKEPSVAYSTASDQSENASILRLLLLKAISTQLTVASERINAGAATTLAVSQLIAVGFNRGDVLLFDSGQTLKWCFQEFLTDGAACSLAFNYDDTRLLVGYAGGETSLFRCEEIHKR